MDCKFQIITDVLGDMSLDLNQTQLTILKNSMIKVLNNYDIKPSETSKYALMTVDELNDSLLKGYVTYKTIQGKSQNSIKQYVRETRKCLYTLNKRATEITTDELEMYIFGYKVANGVSDTTICNMKCYINNFFAYLVDKEYITKNPCDKISHIKGDTVHEKAFTKTEEEKLYGACDNLRDRAIIETLFSTGCRVGEIEKVNIDNVNFDTKTIDVVGKGNKHRTVCIGDKAIYHLKNYLDSRNDTNTALFVSNNKLAKRLTVSGIECLVGRIGEKAKVNNVHPHRFRASFATRLVDAGMALHQVSKLLGHSSVETTMIYYRGDYNLSNDYNKLANNM